MRRLWVVMILGVGCDDGAGGEVVDAEADQHVAADRGPSDAQAVDRGGRDAAPDATTPDGAPDRGVAMVDAGPPGGVDWVGGAAVGSGPIQEIAVVALAGEIYVLGGFDRQARMVNRVSVYDPATDRWREAAPLPVRMHHANTAVVDGRIWVLGFLVGGFAADGRGFVYDPTADEWSPTTAMPEGAARGASGVAAVGSKIYVMGGLQGRAVRAAHVFDTTDASWAPLPDMPTIRDHMAAGAIDGQVVIAGGRDGRIEGLSDRVDIFDPVAGEWRRGAPIPTPRGGTAAAVLDGSLFVIGGEGNPATPSGVFAEVEAYDLAQDRWVRHPDMPTPRHGMWAATLEGRIYVPGGADRQAFGAVDTHEIIVPR